MSHYKGAPCCNVCGLSDHKHPNSIETKAIGE